ncbi:MAG: WbqC family protein [Candidatus Omnitrophota bacterium]
MVLSVHQPQYIPWLGYFDKIAKSDTFVFLDQVQYKPREFQNRNKIRTQNGWMWLSVPVVGGKGRQKICDCLIENESDWQEQHLRSLKTWYAKSGFFDAHLPFFQGLYSTDWARLMDLNIEVINYILGHLGIEKKIYLESGLNIQSAKTERIVDLCSKLGADTYLSGVGGKDYLEEEKFSDAGIHLVYQDFVHPVYRQQFTKEDSDFIPFMSCVDLLFNEGARSKEVLGL